MTDSSPRRVALSPRDRVLAVVLVLATVGLLLFLRSTDSDDTKTSELSEVEPIAYLSQDLGPDWSEAALQYRSGMFNAAASHYEKLVGNGPDTRRARLFLGSCQVQSRRFDAAELTLRPLLTPGTLDSVESAGRWLLAQVYLARNEGEPARDELARLLDNPIYGNRAREITAALDAILNED
jgi:hypothetical protein